MGKLLQLNVSEEALFGVSPPMGLRRRILGSSTLRWLDRNAKHLDQPHWWHVLGGGCQLSPGTAGGLHSSILVGFLGGALCGCMPRGVRPPKVDKPSLCGLWRLWGPVGISPVSHI